MKKIILILTLIFLVSCSRYIEKSQNEVIIDNGKQIIRINVEVADEEKEWEKGLMLRDKLDENSGMLFVFEREKSQSFWMKNTLIPLDMIFINQNFGIVDIKYAVPCEKDPCKLYKSAKPAKYVLEVNGNFTARNNINLGNKITIS
ncbi:MAG TPA: DUF192 domain-containing protein [Candidatus Nanoarchaeia archaeon]|nr:DUF192 domain-containing protein [Candidatus Nanoarchaeia archaeon]